MSRTGPGSAFDNCFNDPDEQSLRDQARTVAGSTSFNDHDDDVSVVTAPKQGGRLSSSVKASFQRKQGDKPRRNVFTKKEPALSLQEEADFEKELENYQPEAEPTATVTTVTATSTLPPTTEQSDSPKAPLQ